MEVSVSFLKSIYDTKKTIEKLDVSKANFLHVDIMDGKFVENKNYSALEIFKLLNKANKPLDIHLMVKNPLKYLDDLALLNTEYFTFHFEAVTDILKTIKAIKDVGLKVGISIKPETKIEEIVEYLKYLDQVLVMSVNPGMGGQEFLPNSLDKIKTLKNLKELNNYNYQISVDGGVNLDNLELIKEAGTDIIVVGSFVTNYENFDQQINLLIGGI